MSADAKRLKEIFGAAIDQIDKSARRALLDRECGDDAELRARVEALLEAHDHPAPVLERPLAAPPGSGARVGTTVDHAPVGRPGLVIAGRYQLLEKIGEGGMGEVWAARQVEPVRRKVAVKLIRAGMDSRPMLARFEVERQALALMDHPNIARVFDGGLTDDGRPFFAMELVNGLSITRYCDDARLSPRERLELFLPVCAAVQHAHQKGVVHRDLKPSNVLITLYDGVPVPKIIDFGVAKALGGRLTEQTVSTGFGAVVGTVEYMAPEQAAYSALDVDTRADIYSLGVILYELLTGLRPFDPLRLKSVAFDELLRIVREDDPVRPSARISTDATLASAAAARRIEPHRLVLLLRGELDWVVMRCLEKERSRRYDTASALGRDLQRYLADEPVEARPASAAYRIRKFARRHRGPVFAALLLLLALAAGVVGTSIGLIRADAERRRAVAAREAEQFERQRADEARREAELTAAGLQVDLDLAAVRDDVPFGLLRLARTLRGLPADAPHLREFATLGVLALGQTFAPLLPPISHDGSKVRRFEFGPGARTLLTLGDDRTARLWGPRTAQPIAVLRRGDERVVYAAITPDGRTVVTDSEDGVLRFWDLPGGAFRAESQPRPAAHSAPSLSRIGAAFWHRTVQVAPGRVLTMRDASTADAQVMKGPVELWDTATGRRIARLDRPGMEIWQFRFAAEGRWVTAIENWAKAVIFSSEDGREIVRLDDPSIGPKGDIVRIDSPTGRRVVTLHRTEQSIRATTKGTVWEVGSWKPLSIKVRYADSLTWVRDLGDDLFTITQGGCSIYRRGERNPLAVLPLDSDWEFNGDLIRDRDGSLYRVPGGQRLIPPPGRRFHPELAQFAPGGRLVSTGDAYAISLIDPVADKQIANDNFKESEFGRIDLPRLAHAPGLGLVGLREKAASATLLVVPDTPPAIRPDWLELWLQVAVRGELGPDGRFAKWDEATWERKRRALAALPAVSVGVPFPGHVADDRLHWLRREYEGPDDAHDWLIRLFGEPGEIEAHLHVAEELLRRAPESPDPHEAARWRLEIARLKTEIEADAKRAAEPAHD